MDTALVGTLSALAGSAIGSLAPVFSSVILQRSTTHREFLTRNTALREVLYSDFIREASALYVSSLTRDLENFDQLIGLYALVSRIRLVSSDMVVDAAEAFVRVILGHFAERNLSVAELQQVALAAKAPPLEAFSVACRIELQTISSTMRLPKFKPVTRRRD